MEEVVLVRCDELILLDILIVVVIDFKMNNENLMVREEVVCELN